MTSELTTAVCPLCAAGTTAVIRPRRDGYAYRRFQRCGLGRAYPVFSNAYEPARRRLETSTGTSNLLSVWRNGEFAHTLMADVNWGHLEQTGSA
jgi:hypothetical protein